MARDLTAYGRVEAGKLYITHRPEFDQAVGAFADGMVSVQIKRVGRKRSNPQLRYYRGCVVPILTAAINESWGESLDEDEVHELLKRLYNSRIVETENGHKVKIAVSTGRLDTGEMNAYIERCRQFGAEIFGVNIPDPGSITSAKTEINV